MPCSCSSRSGRRRRGAGHEAVLYFRPLADRDSDEFFADARYGEFWVGARPTLADVELELGLTARHIDELDAAAAKDAGEVTVRLVRDADPELTARLDAARVENGAAAGGPAGVRRRARPRHLAPADAQGRLRGRADARRRGGHPPRVRGDDRRAAAGGRGGPRRALARGHLRAARPAPRQRGRLRLDLRRRRPRQHAALDQEHRRGARRRPRAHRRRRRGRLALHRRHHPHPARLRHVHRRPARGLRRRATPPRRPASRR